MDYEIVERPAFAVAGFSSSGMGQGIPGTWKQLGAARADWPSAEQFGIGRPTMSNLHFLAGVRVPPGAALPAGWEVDEVPAGRYLKQHYSGDRRKMANEVSRLFSVVVPAASEQCPAQMLFFAEYQGDVSDPSQAQIECDLYVLLT